MVCIRCQMVVKSKLEKLGLQYSYVKIGEAKLVNNLPLELEKQLKEELEEVGLFLIDNKRSILVERIKNIIIELVHFTDEQIKVNLSLIIYDELNLSEIAWKLNYSSVAHLSNQFKKYTGLTPTQFRNLNNRKRETLETV